MRSIQLSALAERDLIGIWQYSCAQWGEAQPDQYLDALDEGIRLLAAHPELGGSRDRIRHGYRVLFIKSPPCAHGR